MMRVRTARELGLKVRERRRELGWTQEELANRVGVGRKRIVAIEGGARRTELAPVLAVLAELGLAVNMKVDADAEGARLSDLDLARRPGGPAALEHRTVDLDDLLSINAREDL